MTGINREALEHAATFAFEMLNNDGWEPGELSAEDVTRQIVDAYLEKKREIDSEVECQPADVVTQYICPPIPDRRWDWCAYRKGEEESGNYGWGRTAQEAVEELEAMYEDEA